MKKKHRENKNLFAPSNMMNVGHRRSIRLLKRITVDRPIGDENKNITKKKPREKEKYYNCF